jgi:predicted DNA-binding protein (UPF0251 family)
MPRPTKPRHIHAHPDATYFKPRGIPLRDLDEIVLGLDEFEAFRLADLEGCSHEDVGYRMNVSRSTAGRLLAEARRKVARALFTGSALRIEGGPTVSVAGRCRRRCCTRRGHGGDGRGGLGGRGPSERTE